MFSTVQSYKYILSLLVIAFLCGIYFYQPPCQGNPPNTSFLPDKYMLLPDRYESIKPKPQFIFKVTSMSKPSPNKRLITPKVQLDVPMMHPEKVDVSNFIPDKYILVSKQYAHIKSYFLSDIIAISRLDRKDSSTGRSISRISVISFDWDDMDWKPIYQSEVNTYSIKCEIISLIPLQNQLIVSFREGSGGFLYYKILGFRDNEMKLLLERNWIFQGGYELYNGQLIEYRANNLTLFKWENDHFSATELDSGIQFPMEENDKIIRFFHNPDDGTISVTTDPINLNLGNKIQLLKTNRYGVERILFSGNIFKSEKRKVLKAVAAGTGTITIIPGGYTWEKAKDITIIVQ